MRFFPPRDTKQLRQLNRGKILGELWSSFGLDLFSELGLIKLSPRLRINTSGVSNQGLSVSFKTFDQILFTLAGTRVFKNSAFNLISPFVEDASTGAITTYNSDYSDMEVFNSTLVTTSVDKVMSKIINASGTGAWTQRATLNTVTSLHKLCYGSKFNRIYYIDDFSGIKSMDTSWSEATSGSYFIDIPRPFGFPFTLCDDSSDIWIGTVNAVPSGQVNSTKGASILRWDAISSQVTSRYEIPAQGVLALCKDDRGIIHAIDTNGALLQFNGSGFDEIGRLPLTREVLINGTSLKYNGFIHPNGFSFTRNGTFIVNINNLVGDSGATVKENIASGIWEWSKESGFIHRQSYTYNALGSTSITDYGQNRISQVGALYQPNIYSADATGKPNIICGATYYTNASSTATGIFVDDPLDALQKYGYFVSSWTQSQSLKDTWQKLAVKYRKFLDSADRIWIKYRLTEASPVEFTLTWSALSPTTVTFTTSTDLTGKEGYEVEVLQGTGSGKGAHIVSITNNAGTYTVVLDEPFTGVTTGTAKGRYQAWIKTLVVSDQLTESVIKTIANATSERVQLKVCMQFTGEDELHEVALLSAPHTQLL